MAGPSYEGSWGALPDTPAGRVDAAISAWTVNLRREILGAELSPEDERKYLLLVRAAQ